MSTFIHRLIGLVIFLGICAGLKAQPPPDLVLRMKDAVSLGEQHFHLLKSRKYEAEASEKKIDVIKYTKTPSIDATYQAGFSSANNITGQFYPYGIIPMTGPVFTDSRSTGATGSAASILLNWEVTGFGERNAGIDLSIAEARSKTAAWQQEVFNHKVSIIGAYLDLLLAFDILTIQRRNVDRAQENLRQSIELTKSGLKPGADTALFRSELSKANIEWLNARQQLQMEQWLLAQLVVTDSLPVPSDTAFLQMLPLTRSGQESNLSTHPFIQYSQSEWAFSKSREGFLKKSYLPKLTVWGTGFSRGSGFYPDGTIKTWDGMGLSKYNYGAGLQLSIPIMKIGEAKREIHEQALLSKAAEEKMLDIKSTLSTQQKIANTAFENSVAITEESQRQLESADYAYYAIRIRYQSGLVNFSDLITAQYNLLKAETDLKKSRWNVWKALLMQASAMGDENIFLNQIK
jgi:outer membrane protein TolC